MKRIILLATVAVFLQVAVYAQPVHDRGVVPVAVTLNRVMRLNITSGGNMEFVFNSIKEYENGLNSGGASSFYQTAFYVAASNDWNLVMGAEDATLLPTDHIAAVAGIPTNSMALNNVGFNIVHVAGGTLANANYATPVAGFPTTVAALAQYTGAAPLVIASAAAPAGDAGDALDNSFQINWRAGTAEGTMTATTILHANIFPDRYVTNVFMDIQVATQ